MGLFNNRELAVAIWTFVALAAILSKKDLRPLPFDMIRAFFVPKLLLCFAVIALYSAFVIKLFSSNAFWVDTLTKEAIVWILVAGIASTMGGVTDIRSGVFNGEILKKHFGVLIVLEFFIGTYVFSLSIELLLIPIVTAIALLDSVARSRDRFLPLARLTSFLVTIIGLVVLASALYKAVADYRQLATLDSLLSFLLPVAMSIAFVPLVYLGKLVSGYETAFIRLNYLLDADRETRRYAKRLLVARIRMSLKQLRNLLLIHSEQLMKVRDKSDVDRLILRLAASG